MNAGIMQLRMPVIDTPIEVYDQVFAVNCRGVFLGLKASAKIMKASQTRGSIILTGSQLGLDGTANLAAYSATKFAVRGLALSAAAELGPLSIRVNCVAPGPILTPMSAPFPETNTALAAQTMLGRMGQAPEIANAMVYLASDMSSFVTGTTLKVDGGWSKFG